MTRIWKISKTVCTLAIASLVLVGTSVAEEGDQRGDRPERGPRRGGAEGRQVDPDRMIQAVMQMDLDSDGKISEDEAVGSRLERGFERVDANQDGFVTEEELKSMLERRPKPEGKPGEGRPGEGRGPRGFEMTPGIPRFMMEELQLTDDQKKDLEALREEMRKKMEGILSQDQLQKLRDLGRRGPGDAEAGPRRGPRDGDQEGDRPRGLRRGGDRDGDRDRSEDGEL